MFAKDPMQSIMGLVLRDVQRTTYLWAILLPTIILFAGCAENTDSGIQSFPQPRRHDVGQAPSTNELRAPPTTFVKGAMDLHIHGAGVRELLVTANESLSLGSVRGTAGRAITVLAAGIHAPWENEPCESAGSATRFGGFSYGFDGRPAGTYRLIVASLGDETTNVTVSFTAGLGSPGRVAVEAESVESDRHVVLIGYQPPTATNPLDVEFRFDAASQDFVVSRFSGFALVGAGTYNISSAFQQAADSLCANDSRGGVYAHAPIYGYGIPATNLDAVVPKGEVFWRGHFSTSPYAVTSAHGLVLAFRGR